MAEREDILQIYRFAVRNAIASGNSEVVPNSTPQHAAIIIEEMADAAEKRFLAFSGAFHDDVWTVPVMEALRRALRRGVEISLVASDNADRMPEELKGCCFVIRREVATAAEHAAGVIPDHHFAIMDGHAVRVEYDLGQRKAAFSANRPDVANALIDEFLKLKGMSEKAVA